MYMYHVIMKHTHTAVTLVITSPTTTHAHSDQMLPQKVPRNGDNLSLSVPLGSGGREPPDGVQQGRSGRCFQRQEI